MMPTAVVMVTAVGCGRGFDAPSSVWTAASLVGVLPASFCLMIGITADTWIPLSRRGMESDARVGLRPGELSTFAPPLQQEGAFRWGGIPVEQDVRARTGGATVWIFLPAAVVLIIGCVNVACMLLARGMRREVELSVRMALGAGRGAIFRQLFLENSLLAVAAGIIGTALAFAGLDFVVRTMIAMKPELAAALSGDFGLLPIALTSSIAACCSASFRPCAFRDATSRHRSRAAHRRRA
jgi:hypothetical protein